MEKVVLHIGKWLQNLWISSWCDPYHNLQYSAYDESKTTRYLSFTKSQSLKSYINSSNWIRESEWWCRRIVLIEKNWEFKSFINWPCIRCWPNSIKKQKKIWSNRSKYADQFFKHQQRTYSRACQGYIFNKKVSSLGRMVRSVGMEWWRSSSGFYRVSSIPSESWVIIWG